MSTALTTGDRFIKRNSRTYTETNGTRGTHTIETLCEVTATNQTGLTYAVIDVLTETGRPTTFHKQPPTGGTMAWFGLEAAIARGDIREDT